jgi:dCMP deaminase
MRPTWREYFLDTAKVVSTRATCLRAKVGVVIVKQNRILSTGYNGSAPGERHCNDLDSTGHPMGCLLENGHCILTTHGEINAIGYAARYGVALDGATLYTYKSDGPAAVCRECRKASVAAGIWEFISVGGDE